MKLTRNEKRTLKLLLNNARISDSKIASELGISSVAVGKIRRKLETSVIKSYTLDLDYAKLGIQTFAIAIAKLTAEGLNKGQLEVEQKLMKIPHIINVYRIPKGSSTHIILYGFMDMTELDNFFHSPRLVQELHAYIENQEIYTFSHNSLIKHSPVQLFSKVLETMGTMPREMNFKEIEMFKKRL